MCKRYMLLAVQRSQSKWPMCTMYSGSVTFWNFCIWQTSDWIVPKWIHLIKLQLVSIGVNFTYTIFKYRPQRSCEGYVFTGVCLSIGGGSSVLGDLLRGGLLQGGAWSRGGWYPSMHWGRPPRRYGYCRGRYASYWNAFLLVNYLICNYLRPGYRKCSRPRIMGWSHRVHPHYGRLCRRSR